MPENFVDRRDRVFRADGVLYRHVEVGEEARVDLAVRREPEARAAGAERLGDGGYDAEGARGSVEAELVGGGRGVVFLDRLQVPELRLGAVQDLASRR